MAGSWVQRDGRELGQKKIAEMKDFKTGMNTLGSEQARQFCTEWVKGSCQAPGLDLFLEVRRKLWERVCILENAFCRLC